MEEVEPVPFFDLLPLFQSESENLHEALDSVIQSGFAVGGPVTQHFETEFARFVDAKYCAGVGNGLDAIRLALEALGIGNGDEVIVPGFTYYATWLAVTQTGAKLVPVDVQLNTGNIDPEKVQKEINNRTKAILAVNLFGQAADLRALREVATANNLFLVEDAAQSHGAYSNAGGVGSIADVTAYSFYPTKNLGAMGDAGAVVTNLETIYEKIKSRRSYGQGQSKYEHIDTGWNSRLDPFQAAVLSMRLSKLSTWNEARREIASRYLDSLGTININKVIGIHSPTVSVWHHFVLRAENREQLVRYFLANGVRTDVHYPYWIGSVLPLKEHIATQSIESSLSNSILLSKSVLSLPIAPWMNEGQVLRVCSALENIPTDLLSCR